MTLAPRRATRSSLRRRSHRRTTPPNATASTTRPLLLPWRSASLAVLTKQLGAALAAAGEERFLVTCYARTSTQTPPRSIIPGNNGRFFVVVTDICLTLDQAGLEGEHESTRTTNYPRRRSPQLIQNDDQRSLPEKGERQKNRRSGLLTPARVLVFFLHHHPPQAANEFVK